MQAEAYDYEESFFIKRLWHIDREAVNERAVNEAVTLLAKAQNPLIIAGGGVHYSFATETLSEFALQHAIPVAETQAGKSALAASHPFNVGGIGVTGTAIANQLAAQADVILVIGSRLQDFTTASKWGFQNKQCHIIHLNVSRFDAMKMHAMMLKGDAKRGLQQLSAQLNNYKTSSFYQKQIAQGQLAWASEVERLCAVQPAEGLSQIAVVGLINQLVSENDVIISAAGSLPGDLHRIWRSKKSKDYHLEYAYSCMGYEVAAGLGVRLAREEGEVYVLVGDGSFLMMHSELLTSLQEDKKITVVIFDNHGYQCIRNLQESQGSQGFGNEFRSRDPQTQRLTGAYLPIDFCNYAKALGAKSFFPTDYKDLASVFSAAKEELRSAVIVIPVLPKTMSAGYETWWRVAVAAVSKSTAVRDAHNQMQEQIATLPLY